MYLTRLYPAPAVYEECAGCFSFGGELRIFLPEGTDSSVKDASVFDAGVFDAGVFDANPFAAMLETFCCTASRITSVSAPLPPFCAFVTAGDAPARLPLPDAQGFEYALAVTPSGAAIRAHTREGLLHAFAALAQCIVPDCLDLGAERFHIGCVRIADRPALPVRAIHFCLFPETDLSLLERVIRMAGFFGLTHLVLEFWGTLRYDVCRALAWEGRSHSKDELRPYIDLARSLGVEVVPMLNSLGHAAMARERFGRHTILAQDPRLERYFEPDGWTWCVSNPDTRKLLSEMRAELCELCGEGAFFHLGCDEARSFATCEHCRKENPPELLAEYLNGIADELASSGRRGILWGDALLDSRAWPGLIATGGRTHEALDALDRRFLIADWQYGVQSGSVASTAYFMEKGFDVLLSPWDDYENLRALSSYAQEAGAAGVLLTTWHHMPQYLRLLPDAASMLWEKAPYEHPYAITEAAALLRRVCRSSRFEDSGWNGFEVSGDEYTG